MSPEAVLALTLATALLPAALGSALSRSLGLRAQAARRLTHLAAGFASLGALACAALFASGRGASGNLVELSLGPVPLALGARLDGLTALLLPTVTLIGAVVARYAVRYLDGDPAQARFSRWLAFTLSGALFTLVASNLGMFLLGSVATSHGLHRLLCYDPGRTEALRAARERFLVARLGDLLLLAACGLTLAELGTLDFGALRAAADTASSPARFGIALLLVAWAVTQTAQFPFHTWLPNTLSAPTPVSALMHAGIVNAGGILLIRCGPLLALEPAALTLLATAGTFTAVFGSLVMLTQTEIKAKYAYSTVSQMGFMMLQCGLGAFAPAALHLVGHSLYKGHAFLTAASAVDPEPVVDAPRRPFAAPAAGPGLRGLAVLLAGAGLVAALLLVLGVDLSGKPGSPVLYVVLALAVGQMLQLGFTPGKGSSESLRAGARPAILRDLVLGGVALATAYVIGVSVFERVLGDALPREAPELPAGLLLVLVLAFVASALVQELAARGGGRLRHARAWHAAYTHLRHGLYVEELQARLTDRLWPLRPAAARAAGAPDVDIPTPNDPSIETHEGASSPWKP